MKTKNVFKVVNFNGNVIGVFDNVGDAIRLATWNKDKTSSQQVVDVSTGNILFTNINGHTTLL